METPNTPKPNPSGFGLRLHRILWAACGGTVKETNPRPRRPRAFEDADGDGFLYSTELRGLASAMGFEGSDSEWTQEDLTRASLRSSVCVCG